jgi:hypothetical protein
LQNFSQICWVNTPRDEETAAHASDTLARKLTENGEKGHRLNFPDDYTEVYPEVTLKKRTLCVLIRNKEHGHMLLP